MLKRFLTDQIAYFLKGFCILMIFGVILFVANLFLGLFDGLGKWILELFFPKELIISGTGVFLIIIIFWITGFLDAKKDLSSKVLKRIPGVGKLFGGGDIFERILKARPCLFLYSPTCPAYAWILGDIPVFLRLKKRLKPLGTIKNLYYPNIPTIATGQMFPVFKNNIMLLGNSSQEVLKMAMYGIEHPERLIFVPWEEESEDEFIDRATLFKKALEKYGVQSP